MARDLDLSDHRVHWTEIDLAGERSARLSGNGETMTTTYDREKWQAAFSRFNLKPKELTDDDLAQLALVDPQFADRARAARIGYAPATDPKLDRATCSHQDLIDFMENFLQPVLGTYRHRCNELEKRIAELETALTAKILDGGGVRWRGVHEQGERYAEGSLTTRDGSLWLAVRTTTERPGRSDHWRLVVKNGSYNRDGRE